MKGCVSLVTVGIILMTILRRSYALEFFEDLCNQVLDIGESGSVMYSGAGQVYATDYYNPFVDCTVTLQTSVDRQILLTWPIFKVDCIFDVLQIYDGTDVNAQGLNTGQQCGVFSDYPNTVSTGNSLTVRLLSGNNTGDTKEYKFAYTSFSTGGSCKGDEEFKCKNGRCIDKVLTNILDFYDNCGDGSDTEAFGDAVSGLLKWGLGVLIGIIIAIAVVVILVCVACGCLCYHCCCKQKTSNQSSTVVYAPPPEDGMGMQHKA